MVRRTPGQFTQFLQLNKATCRTHVCVSVCVCVCLCVCVCATPLSRRWSHPLSAAPSSQGTVLTHSDHSVTNNNDESVTK